MSLTVPHHHFFANLDISLITLDAAPAPPVNVYLVHDDPLTLIDTGPNLASSLTQLEEALRQTDHTIEDIGLVILTHQHPDHSGLASLIHDRSGAPVAAWHEATTLLQNYRDQIPKEWLFLQRELQQLGVPNPIVAAAKYGLEAYRSHGNTVEITHPIPPKAKIELQHRTFDVLHLPGHSPSDIALYDRVNGYALVGDIVLRGFPSTPTLTQDLKNPQQRFPSGVKQLRSFTAITEQIRGQVTGLSGHGELIDNIAEFAVRRQKALQRRADKFIEIANDQPGSTPYNLAQIFYGELATNHLFTTMSELSALLDILQEAKQVEIREVQGSHRVFNVSP